MALGKGFGERDRNAAGAAADIERAATGLEPHLHIRHGPQPVRGEPMLILAAVHHIEAEHALGPKFLERDAAAIPKRSRDIRRKPQQHRHDRE